MRGDEVELAVAVQIRDRDRLGGLGRRVEVPRSLE
jgi:hypothetical protein